MNPKFPYSFVLLAMLPTVVVGQPISEQIADPNFNPKVERPAYTKDRPNVLFDEAHFNFHTAGGRYKAFADLIGNDGYQVVPGTRKFEESVLEGFDILIIANATGNEDFEHPRAADPAFTEEECDAIRDWVWAGGSLFLVTDHEPTGAAVQSLAGRFGVDMSKGIAVDPSNSVSDTNPSRLIFRRISGLLNDHPITRGRNAAERINTVITYGGQSLKGPRRSIALLNMAGSARDLANVAEMAKLQASESARETPMGASAAGRSQLIALVFGKGRVVVSGEAGMFAAQVQVTGTKRKPFGGLNAPGVDNRQLALNIMHWLSGLL